jgi:mRNA interferase MazF
VEIARGSIVIVAAKGAYTGKPRPALVVQADLFNPTHASVTICPITSDVVDAPLFRITLAPGRRSGLAAVSQVMVDKVISVPRTAIAREIGQCDSVLLDHVGDALRLWLGL